MAAALAMLFDAVRLVEKKRTSEKSAINHFAEYAIEVARSL